ncbi:hypothetical protein [Streptomyces sp. CBMA123]|uniref:hypothetical protein n=1 Tax=Streptomyces sp. CBMA123 TaxID=1896313 RepID=UPI001CB7E7DA|nr:hypothetical protein [Streptomyces sp. CBMA123]MBD0694749.1 hypothetical protein [Streptomyces sp. CBMA123]
MTSRKPSAHKSMEDGQASRHDGEQHGWSGDIDAEEQQSNDSAHRSFHPDEYAPRPGPGREPSPEEEGEVPGQTVKSDGPRGEDQGPSPHRRDHGPQGPSGRPAGGYTQEARTGVDPQEPDTP